MSKSSGSKTKRFLHKEVIFSKEVGATFEELLKLALKTNPEVSSRMQAGSEEGEQRFINYHLSHSSEDGHIFGCEFLGFESGADQSIIEMGSGEKELNVDAMEAGPDKEFLGGSVYFGVRDDHMILFQSMGLRTVELESYLNWFFQECTEVVDEDTYLSLQDHISKKQRSKMKGVKGIRFETPMVAQGSSVPASVKPASEPDQSAKQEITVVPKKHVWSALKSFLGEEFELPSFVDAKKITELTDLEVQIFLKWKGRHKESDNQFMNSIASQMRHVNDEVDYTIHSESGTTSRDKIKLAKAFSVAWTQTGRPKLDLLFPKMSNWLDRLLNTGSVDP